jgi:uncharacterized Zn-binding protein involved in type VI secretion
MPGFLLHAGATVICPHGGSATPAQPDSRVTIDGQPIATLSSGFVIAGCTLSGSAGCQTAHFVTAANRVTANGQPVLLSDSKGICEPSGTPLVIGQTQTRVSVA